MNDDTAVDREQRSIRRTRTAGDAHAGAAAEFDDSKIDKLDQRRVDAAQDHPRHIFGNSIG